jgi:hypothetical protein
MPPREGMLVGLCAMLLALPTGCSNTDKSCAPQDAENLPAFVQPNAPVAACTDAQIQAFYAACFAGASGIEANIAAEGACDGFHADASNAACIQCIVTNASSATWGPIVKFPNGYYHANIGGCIARIDNDAAPGSCAATEQSREQCQYLSCAATCPSPLESQAFLHCSSSAASSTCADVADAAMCREAGRYTGCVFSDFQGYFMGLGRAFCEGAGGSVDAGTDADGPI